MSLCNSRCHRQQSSPPTRSWPTHGSPWIQSVTWACWEGKGLWSGRQYVCVCVCVCLPYTVTLDVTAPSTLSATPTSSSWLPHLYSYSPDTLVVILKTLELVAMARSLVTTPSVTVVIAPLLKDTLHSIVLVMAVGVV